MNRKIYTLLVVIILVLIIGWWGLKRSQNNIVFQPVLSNEMALALLKDELFADCRPEKVEGKYNSCSVSITKDGEQMIITVTYGGLYDDSVKASRIQTAVRYKDGQWVKGDISRSQQCQPRRGHQNFSTDPCN